MAFPIFSLSFDTQMVYNRYISPKGGDFLAKEWYVKIKELGTTFFNYKVSAWAASVAFFLIISAFPLAMLLITLAGYIPGVEQHMLQSELLKVMPAFLTEFLTRIWDEIYAGQTVTLISVTAVTALWAASRGFVSLIRGMNLMYGIEEKRNYFLVRGMAMLCTFGLLFAILLSFLLGALGQKIAQLFIHFFPALERAAFLVVSFRFLFLFIILSALFLGLYLLVPSRRSSIKAELPGAVLSALGWLLFSWLYSFYLSYANGVIYGSLTSAVFIMLWLYICIYILFLGAKLNCYLLQLKKGE